MKALIKKAIKNILPYPPVPAMTIDNTYAYLDALWHKRLIDGPVVEIGCASGGTTAWACRFLSRINSDKQYYCFDTFSGFVDTHLSTDHEIGLSHQHDKMFSDNSVKQFKNNLSTWGIKKNVHIIQGDICEVGKRELPQNISVCLLDVDLRDPIYEALKLLHGKMAKNGIILVDDCKEGTSWVGANLGYMEYCRESGFDTKYFMGFGVIEFSDGGQECIPWLMSDTPNTIPGNFYGE